MYCIEVMYIVYFILMVEGGIYDNNMFLNIKFLNLIFFIVLLIGGLLMFLFFFSGKVDKFFFFIVWCEKCFFLWINICYLLRKNKKNFFIKEE